MEPVKAKCLKTVADDEGIYNIKGKTYEVWEDHGDTIVIEAEESSGCDSIQIRVDDPDFLILYEEEE